jgi:hypothetical protein
MRNAKGRATPDGAGGAPKKTRQLPRRMTVMLCLLGIAVPLAAAGASPPPKTVFQCQKRFKPGSQRAACIKRVTAKRGSSCSKPLFSGEAVDGGTIDGSDTKDFTAKVRQLPGRNPNTPEPMGLILEVEVKNPHIEICRADIVTYSPDRVGTSEPPKRTVYNLSIPPHGGESRVIQVPGTDSFGGAAYARLK